MRRVGTINELSPDGVKVLKTMLAIDPRSKHERQSHTDRAIGDAAKLSPARTTAACAELMEAGYIASAKSMHWDDSAPSLTSFRLTARGHDALSEKSPKS